MKAFVAILLGALGTVTAYYPQRESPYNSGPNDPYSVDINPKYFQSVPYQRLFWSNTGTNQVGGTGLWATLANKFPFLTTMFSRMELPNQYGPPNVQGYDTGYQYNSPSGYPQNFGQNYVPNYPSGGRDVGLTDDAVIVTPPRVPIGQPAPQPDQGYHYDRPQYRLDLPHK